jgi:AraC-like DNA-binding protein
MKCQLENILVDCLRETLHVLLCTDSFETSRLTERILRQCPLYSLFKAKSPSATEELLSQVQSWHVAIIDENCQFASDFKSVLNGFPVWLPVITLTNTWSMGNVSTSGRMLNMTSFVKPCLFQPDLNGENSDLRLFPADNKPAATCSVTNPVALLHAVQEWSIKRKLLSKTVSGLAADALVQLFCKNPLSVEEWSSIMGVKPRRFQREFKTFTDLSPKKILALYHAYRIAFNVLDNQNSRDKGVVPAYMVDNHSRERVMEYVLTHRSSLLTAVG